MTDKDLDEKWKHLTTKDFEGFAVPPGWVTLVDKLCLEIHGYLEKFPEVPRIKVEQVKSKFAGLRFYYTGGDNTVYRLVSLAENLSEEMCETCGSIIEVKKEGSWVTNICKTCKEKKK